VITGDISDKETNVFLNDVLIENIQTGIHIVSDENGKFSIAAGSDDLLEFRKTGYKTARVRIPKGAIPPYFKIILQKSTELPDYTAKSTNRDWKKDSITYHNLYETYLAFEKLSGLDVIRHPFSALSKRNRQIWAFQKEYDYFQKEKFIDYTFNAELVANLTGLQGDSLNYFMRRFRPGYEQLQYMTEYTFYNYIRQSAVFYRTGIRQDYQPSINRNPN
jgi:hypothetical protein